MLRKLRFAGYLVQTMRDTFTQMLRFGLGILALAGLLYILDVFYFAPHRLPPCVQEQLPPGHICPESLFSSQKDSADPANYKIVWVDARSENDFELNHLMFPDDRMFPIRPGAAMQQLMDAAIERLMAAYERGECIVVFCTESCNSSDQVAQELRASGLIKAPVYVLEGGWSALRKAGLASG